MNRLSGIRRLGTQRLLLVCVFCGLAAGTGCRQKIAVPAYTADSSGPQALAAFDANKDGKLDAKELEKSPGLKVALASCDKDGDGALTADEITARVKAYGQGGVALMPFSCFVTLDGEPLQKAKITLTPEPFMGPEIKPATAETDKNGFAGLAVEELKAKGFAGVHCGVYRVTITCLGADGKESIPAAFNTDTTLGVEVAPDTPGAERGRQFELKSAGAKAPPGQKT